MESCVEVMRRSSTPPRVTDLEWMALRAEVLFTQDRAGRLLETREPSGQRAPRFYMGRSRLGNLWRFRVDVPLEQVRDLARLAAREGPLSDSASPPERLQAFRDVLGRTAPVTSEWSGPAYRFPDELAASNDLRDVGVLEIDESNRERLRASFPEHLPEILQRRPCFASQDGDQLVSLCSSARKLPGRGAEAGVETLAASRAQGHASRVVLAWARAVAADGAEPFYSTSWDNVASQGVARRLGLLLVGEDLHLR